MRVDTAQDKALRAWARSNLDQVCAVCGATENLEVDHIVAYSVNADLRYSKDNVQMLCKYHNQSKGNKTEVRGTWFDPDWITESVMFGA